MKRLLVFLVVCALAVGAQGAVVVLKGGKHLEVASWEQKGSFVIVKRADGRAESYPVSAVDLAATRQANKLPEPAAVATPAAAEPHSPFLSALSAKGTSAATITDSDVQHPVPEEAGEAAAQPAASGKEGAAEVVLVNYDRRKVGDGQWELVATVANQGGSPASGVVVNCRFLAPDGSVLGSGSGSYAGNLAPQQQATVTAKVPSAAEPARVAVDLQWQSIREVKPSGTPVPSPAAAKPSPAAGSVAAAPAPIVPGIADGLSPNTVPANANAVGPANQRGASFQVPPAPKNPS